MLLVSSCRLLRLVSTVSEPLLQYRNMATKVKINFNTKHLGKGDPAPAYTGKLRVYNMRYCPFAQRVILALNAKQIDYEVVNINLAEKPEWYSTKSAFGKIPALEIQEGLSVYESLTTTEYIDDAYPQRPLLPKDPLKKAFDKIIVEACGAVHTIFYKTLKDPESINADTIKAYHNALDFVQEQLKSRGSKFLDGSEPGFADYMIWPWFERILVLKESDERLQIDARKYKLLLEYFQSMLKDPAVSQYLVPDDICIKFLNEYKTGKAPNYEHLLEN